MKLVSGMEIIGEVMKLISGAGNGEELTKLNRDEAGRQRPFAVVLS